MFLRARVGECCVRRRPFLACMPHAQAMPGFRCQRKMQSLKHLLSLGHIIMCRRIVEQSLELYTCSATSRDSEMPEYARNGTIPRSYNELATLMSVTGKPKYPDLRELHSKTLSGTR